MARIVKREDLVQGPSFDDLFYIPEDNVKKDERKADLKSENKQDEK